MNNHRLWREYFNKPRKFITLLFLLLEFTEVFFVTLFMLFCDALTISMLNKTISFYFYGNKLFLNSIDILNYNNSSDYNY